MLAENTLAHGPAPTGTSHRSAVGACSLPPLVAPLAAITGVSLETAELLASKFETASRLVEASEAEIADTTLKSGRRVGNVVAKRVKLCFC